MTYDVQIWNEIRRGLSYAELVALPISAETFVRRSGSDWMRASECIELTHILCNRPATNNIVAERNPQTGAEPNSYGSFYSSNQYPDSYAGNGVSNEEIPNEDYNEEDYADEDYADEDYTDDDNDDEGYDGEIAEPFVAPPRELYQDENNTTEMEPRIFIPTAEYFKCRQKRKAAIIGVCTLGFAVLSLVGVGNTWRGNIFAGTSFMQHAGLGFVMKCLSFCFLTALFAIPYFVYSVFALIYSVTTTFAVTNVAYWT